MNAEAKKQDFEEDDQLEAAVPDSDDNDFELEIVDDTPEEDRGRPRRPEGAEPEVPDDDEIENYSDTVQKRIKKLKYEFHEERRRAEEAKRLQDEAIAQAKRATEEAERLRKMVDEGSTLLYSQAEGRVDAMLAQAKRDYKEAYELGDSDKLLEAQEKLANLQNEKFRISQYKQQPRPQPQAAPQAQQPQQPQQPQAPKPSDRAVRWAQKNTWFQKDSRMTAYAFGVHEDLIRNQGVQPDSDEYYRQIDAEMRKMFPDNFEAAPDAGDTPPRKATVVAPASRASAKKTRKVRLTQTQVALAKRLGLTNEQYAAQLMKEQGNG